MKTQDRPNGTFFPKTYRRCRRAILDIAIAGGGKGWFLAKQDELVVAFEVGKRLVEGSCEMTVVGFRNKRVSREEHNIGLRILLKDAQARIEDGRPRIA